MVGKQPVQDHSAGAQDAVDLLYPALNELLKESASAHQNVRKGTLPAH